MCALRPSNCHRPRPCVGPPPPLPLHATARRAHGERAHLRLVPATFRDVGRWRRRWAGGGRRRRWGRRRGQRRRRRRREPAGLPPLATSYQKAAVGRPVGKGPKRCAAGPIPRRAYVTRNTNDGAFARPAAGGWVAAQGRWLWSIWPVMTSLSFIDFKMLQYADACASFIHFKILQCGDAHFKILQCANALARQQKDQGQSDLEDSDWTNCTTWSHNLKPICLFYF